MTTALNAPSLFPLDPQLLRRWGIILVLCGMLMQLSFVFVRREALAHRPFEEDTFFHMTVTRNMAMGKGITIDGVEPSSGAQPGNYVYVLAHLAGGLDKWQALRWARVLDVLGSLAGACCLYGIVRRLTTAESTALRRALALLSAGLWLASFQVMRINLNGYETGFAAAILLWATWIYLVIWQREPSDGGILWDLLFGLIVGLAILCRVDHGFLAASAALCFLWIGPGSLKKKMVRVLIWAAVAVVVTLPWWIFNLKVGGSIMPISGKASAFQMTFHGYGNSVLACLLRTLESLCGIFTVSFYSPYGWGEHWGWIALQLAWVLILIAAVRTQPPSQTLSIRKMDLRPLLFLLIFSIVITLYYVFAHGSSWFMKRYTHPIRAIAYIFVGLYFCYLTALGARMLRMRPALVFNLAMGGFLAVSLASISFTYNEVKSNQFMPIANYLNEHHREGRIGAFQSGTLGYFVENVVNLDGKNNAKALQAVVSRNVIPFMLAQDIRYIADWPEQIAKYCNYEEFLRYYEPIVHVNSHVIYARKETASEL